MRRDHMHKSTQPAGFLVVNRSLLPPAGRALDLAMGAGRNAVYLAKEGFEVEGIDVSTEAVEKALLLAKSEGVHISTLVEDLENGYRLSPADYDVIVCFYYLHRPLIAEIREALKPGGIVVFETYNTDQAEWGRPKNPDHLLKHNELLNMFCDYRILRYREGVIEPRKAIASIIARKPCKEG
ncbi:MAG: class I SAM-dependent methyltransferase [Dehalococcoidia bacterium]|nr:MAG: class I SAM-dependent methyltransferase [Dehalococcoidia bacterium]